MADYIERAELMGKITAAEMQKSVREKSGSDVYFSFLEVINGMPAADVVPVVRCGDCEYCHFYTSWNIYCTHSEGLTSQGPDAFCSYGKRRNGQCR